MPNQPRTPHRTFRADDDLWDEFSVAAQTAGLDTSAALRALMTWFVHHPTAPEPNRPPRPTAEQVRAFRRNRAGRKRRASTPDAPSAP